MIGAIIGLAVDLGCLFYVYYMAVLADEDLDQLVGKEVIVSLKRKHEDDCLTKLPRKKAKTETEEPKPQSEFFEAEEGFLPADGDGDGDGYGDGDGDDDGGGDGGDDGDGDVDGDIDGDVGSDGVDVANTGSSITTK